MSATSSCSSASEAVTSFVLIGHVDHGKSTCAGRILVDTGMVSEREVEKAKTDADLNKMSSWWLAYLLDIGEERYKGKTHEYTIIPVEHKGTSVRLIDVPGHQRFISQMISGASQANLPILICSAKSGELESGLKGQTYEHLALVRSMGLGKLIVAINKMDHPSVKWDMDIYQDRVTSITKILKPLRFREVQFIPISGLDGTNVVIPNPDTPKSLMDLIISTPVRTRKLDIYPGQKEFSAKCLFLNIDSVVANGYQCVLHTYDEVRDCIIEKFHLKRPFITSRDRGYIKVDLRLEDPVDIHTFIILRNGDRTIGIGRIQTEES